MVFGEGAEAGFERLHVAEVADAEAVATDLGGVGGTDSCEGGKGS